MRLSINTIYVAQALVWAYRSTCRVQVGAVLVSPDGRVVASGYNGAPAGEPHCTDVGCEYDSDGHCIRTVHAEENCILQCAVHGVSTKGTTIYCTHEPCDRCTKRLLAAGVKRMVYLNDYKQPNSLIPKFKFDKKGELDELLLSLYTFNKNDR